VNRFALLVILAGLASTAHAEDLALTRQDVRVVPGADGYHLIVRQIAGVASVMLTESAEPAGHQLATYSFRALSPNAVNGAEKRLLNGVFQPQPNLFLLSSTPVADPFLGQAFDILIPLQVEFGSKTAPNARYGKLDVGALLSQPGQKFSLSIRTFAKPYADYTGAYRDNWFDLSLVVEVQAPAAARGVYTKGLEELFHRLGPTYKAADASDGVRFLRTLMRSNVDLVLCLDTTGSMAEDLKVIRSELLPDLPAAPGLRLGLVLYKDYGASYLTNPTPLTADFKVWANAVGRSEASGGGDIPEAAIEAIDAAAAQFGAESGGAKLIVVLADAPQHDTPRGPLRESAVLADLAKRGIALQLIMLPLTGKP
jgi:hypothetical protein